MAKNNQKKKSGLHKEISSIFDGVPVPNDKPAPRSQTGPQQGLAGYDSPRPPANAPQNPQIPGSYQRSSHPAAASAGVQGPLQRIAKRLFPPKAGVSRIRQKMTLLLVPALLVLFVIMLGRVVDITFMTTKKSGLPKGGDSTPPVAVSNEINWQKPAPYPAGLRDPMQLPAGWVVDPPPPPPPEPDPKDLLVVKGILYSPDNASAVIGTEIAHVGDIIAGAKVLKINRNSVEFERDGEIWTQTVEP